jgi:hypothetical protein
MDKQSLISIVNKYYLDGIGEKVKWNVKDNQVTIKTFSATKDMVGIVTAPLEFPDSEFLIFDTSKFIKLVGICGQFLTMDIHYDGNVATKLLIADNDYNLEYALAALMLAPNINFTVEEFESNYSFSITEEFINKWLKARKALSSAYCAVKQTTTDLGPVIEFTLGELEGHSNKVTFIETPSSQDGSEPTLLRFNAEYLKSIFDANYGSKGTMHVNNDGAMKLDFESEDGQKSSYIVLSKV